MKDDRKKFEEFAELEYVATARGEAPRSMLRHWVLERLDDEAP
jgi:hypothetical protein